MENNKIANLLTEILKCVEENQYSEIGDKLNGFISEHPECVDARFQSEVALIEKEMEYKSQLQDWEYFRLIKLVYQYCERIYGNDAICRSGEFDETKELPDQDVIWWCWLQGLKNAPDIVKACYHSLEKIGKKIIILHEDNLREYIDFPDYIWKAKEKGIITKAHFSDLIRLELLTTRGGTWIDATVYCTDEKRIVKLIQDTDLFCFSFAMRDSVSRYMLFDSWFLHSRKPSRILYETKNMLYEYWKRECDLKHYFLFHLFFSIACRRNKEEWNRIPIYSNEPVHIMQLEMMKPYSEKRLEQILEMTDIHKLTYKYDKGKDIRGTFLEYIINQK